MFSNPTHRNFFRNSGLVWLPNAVFGHNSRPELLFLRAIRLTCVLILLGMFISTMVTNYNKLNKNLIGTAVYSKVWQLFSYSGAGAANLSVQ